MLHQTSPSPRARRRARLAALLFALLLAPLAAARPAAAADVTLTECSEPELDAALVAASGGGSIFFACGGPRTIALGASKTIAGAVQISGDGLITLSGADAVRLFVVEAGGNLRLDGLTLVRGRAAGEGGAILNRGALTLDNVAFVGNSAGSGGAVFNAGALVASGSTFIGNSAAADGGAIGNGAAGNTTISTSAFRSNTAGGAGGAIATTGALTLSASTLRGNRAALGGGLAAQGGSPIVRRTQVDANAATQSGGGIYNQATLTLEQSTLSANTAAGDGGGAWSGKTLSATNVTASGNSAASGGGIANEGALSLNNATLVSNTARGGGLFNAAMGTADISNTLLAGNSDLAQAAPDCAGKITALGANLVQRVAGCEIAGAHDVADPLLGPLADNGGATLTHALLTGSPAIDKGDRLSCATEDQRGVGRPVGPRCDIGAFEQGMVVNTVADGTDANLRDFVCETAPGNGQCTLRAAVQQANAIAGVDAIEFAIAGPFTLTLAGMGLGSLDITEDLLINGRGSGSTIIDGGGDPEIGGVLQISPGAHVSIAGVTIRNGDAGANNFGGNLRNQGSATLVNSVVTGGDATAGGGIANFGQLAVRRSTIADNSAGAGGGILNRTDLSVNAAGASMSLSDSTLSGNHAVGEAEGGGGIDNQGQADLTNVTLSGNSASRDGGGIRAQASGVQALTLNNVTLTDNVADADSNGTGDGGGVASLGGSASATNTIIAGNVDRGGQAPDCALRVGGPPPLASLGYNLVGDATGCALVAQPGDKMGGPISLLDPRLGPLQVRGGVGVRPPLTGSPAINAGSPALPGGQGNACSDTDQSGRARPEGGACDIGASEAILADVRVSAPAAPANTFVGYPLTLTIDVLNTGPSPTADVLLALEIAPQLALVSLSASQGACAAAPTPSCSLGALAPNGSARITIEARIARGGAIGLGASAGAAEADPDMSNNAVALTTTARYPLFLPLVARR